MPEQPANDQHLRPLGVITSNFQVIEMVVSLLAWGLIGPDQAIGQIATAQMSFGRLCDCVGALAHYRFADDADLRDEVLEYIAEVSDAENRRNSLVHSAWSFLDERPGEPVRIKITAKRKKGLEIQKDPIALEELKSLGKRMHELILEGHALVNHLHQLGLLHMQLPPDET